ncbi:beta-ketoacyl-ACP synthase III [Myroides indicus]|nr:beta-ketoacyl-ACP synthase III [Myroides indicus]
MKSNLQKQRFAAISAIGGFVPYQKRTNKDLELISDTSDEWIIKRTGIKERRILENGFATSDMAVEAIKNLAEVYHKDLRSAEALIVATSTPDMPMPATANIICQKLNLNTLWAFDVNSACSGFLYALDLGASLIESGRYRNIIVVGADKISSYVNIKDRNTNILFGDGAGAVWLEASSDEGIIDAVLRSNGSGKDFLNIEGGGSLYPFSDESFQDDKKYIKQDGKIVFKNAIQGMRDTCIEVMQRNNFSVQDIQWLVPHQANQRIIDAVGKEIDIDQHKTLTNIKYYGNTIAATIPLCIWENTTVLNKGDLILLTAFGAGFSWGASLLKWTI